MTLVAPRIVNDVSYVTRINQENQIHFVWQAQYLVSLKFPLFPLRVKCQNHERVPISPILVVHVLTG